jgi:hypothetical protein
MLVFVYVSHSVLIVGIPIRSSLDASLTQQYAALIKTLSDKARSAIRDIDPTNELVFFRMRTKKHEILVAPGLYKIQLEDNSKIFLLFRKRIYNDRFTSNRCFINLFFFVSLSLYSI